MNINELLKSGANIQIVVNVADLKEAFLEWANELKQPEEERFLSIDETCQMLKCDKSTLWRWRRDGLIRKRSIGGKVYYLQSDVKKMMEGY